VHSLQEKEVGGPKLQNESEWRRTTSVCKTSSGQNLNLMKMRVFTKETRRSMRDLIINLIASTTEMQ